MLEKHESRSSLFSHHHHPLFARRSMIESGTESGIRYFSSSSSLMQVELTLRFSLQEVQVQLVSGKYTHTVRDRYSLTKKTSCNYEIDVPE